MTNTIEGKKVGLENGYIKRETEGKIWSRYPNMTDEINDFIKNKKIDKTENKLLNEILDYNIKYKNEKLLLQKTTKKNLDILMLIPGISFEVKKKISSILENNNINNKNESNEIIEKEIELGKITKNNPYLSKILKEHGINYYNISKKITYKDASGFEKKYSLRNIPSGSELKLLQKGDKYIISISPPLFVNMKEFERIKINVNGKEALLTKVINNECKKVGINPILFKSLIGTESSFGKELKSNTGYIGYSMLREDTSLAELLRLGIITKEFSKKALENDGKNKENIIAGIKYFSLLYKKFDGYKDQIKLALAAYNGGPTKINNICKKIKKSKNKITFQDVINSGKLSNETKEYPGKILKIAKIFYKERM